jgi:DNA-damage-inducible protein D
MKDLEKYSEDTFESIKHYTDDGIECWLARELQEVLEYKQWRRFNDTIERAKIACENSGNVVADHFAMVGKMVQSGVAIKNIGDIQLSRYACYLIVQNGDPHKEVIALGQTYFAIKTRQQEMIENYDQFTSCPDMRLHYFLPEAPA